MSQAELKRLNSATRHDQHHQHHDKFQRQHSVKHHDIDESLYSRQLYVLGHEAMRKMQASNVLISGMDGLGIEIAKNVILGGVKSVTIHDTKPATYDDLATHFYLNESDVGKSRVETTHTHLADLNAYVPVQVHTGELTEEFLQKFQVVVLTNSPHGKQLVIGDFCHRNNIKFIVAETRGIFGKIFCDFGKQFEVLDVNGETPLATMICHVTNDSQGVVTTLDETRHGFEDGCFVKFVEVKGMTELNGQEFKIKVLSPFTFSIGDTSSFGEYESGGVAEEVKKPKIIDFAPITEARLQPQYVISDFTKMTDNDTIHLAFEAINEFEELHERLPNAWCPKDAEEFTRLANELNSKLDKTFEDLNETILKLFSSVASGSICPLQSVIGGVSAQEIMKACSGKFHPIVQYFYFDCREVLPASPFDTLTNEQCSLTESDDDELKRYKSQIAVFGKDFQRKLLDLNYFIVGSGALGCEYIKNVAMMGVGCGLNGRITLTDMDTIEKSNLNRQFLFRSHDVGQSKALVASNAARRMNPAIHIEPHLNRIAADTENVYNDAFFESLDGVCNALDNVAARNYVDRRCVYYQKPLIESGTLGTQANVQIVLPFLTESYSSTQDPPEKSIPSCTLKNFPNAIEHTLQWARSMFEGLFSNTSLACVEYLKDPQQYLERIRKLSELEALEELNKVYDTLFNSRPQSFEDCVRWARLHWQDSYHNMIQQLLFNFPPDQRTSSGLLFWSGPKRCPHPLVFDQRNHIHVDYVHAAANLRAFMFDIKQVRDVSVVQDMVQSVQVPEFQPRSGVVIQVNDSDAQSEGVDADRNRVDELIEKLTLDRDSLNGTSVRVVEFEKDDDTNYHMDFIVACSNLRAENYDITPASRHKVIGRLPDHASTLCCQAQVANCLLTNLKSKLIAGRIIPAIATTTSTVVGLDCIELYKLTQGHKDMSLYKNSFINLALPFFGLSEPMPAKKMANSEYTLWDRFEIKNEMTLVELLEYFRTEHKLSITMLSHGVIMLYSDFMAKAKVAERLNLKISEIVEHISHNPIPDHVNALVLEICCTDADDNDVDVPYVKYKIK